MAVTHWYTGRATETTATVIVRADSTGDVAVIANGETVQAACDTSVNDGNATALFTGLTPGQTYAYTVGGVAGGNLRPTPANAPFWIALSSCWLPSSYDTLAARLLSPPTTGATSALQREASEGLAAFFALGDLVYMNANGTVNGYLLTLIDGGTLANAKDVSYRRQYYRATRLNPGLRELMRSVPTYLLKDDHEYDPDNACNDIAWAQAKWGGGTTQPDLDAVWTAADTAWREWSTGNPASVLSGPWCYSQRIGPVEFFCTDQIYDRTYHATVDSATKRMMSDAQEQWMLNAMESSSAPFKVWVSTKQFISSCGRNADGWCNFGAGAQGYETQLSRILSDSRFPRRGCLSVTGDEHIASEIYAPGDHFGPGSAAISQIAAGPATIPVITDPDDGLTYRAGVRSKERDTSGLDRRGENNYVMLRVLPDRIERYRLGSRYGLRYMGYISTADNVVRR